MFVYYQKMWDDDRECGLTLSYVSSVCSKEGEVNRFFADLAY